MAWLYFLIIYSVQIKNKEMFVQLINVTGLFSILFFAKAVFFTIKKEISIEPNACKKGLF